MSSRSSLSIDDIINRCNELGVNHINPKTKKPYTKPVLLKKLKEKEQEEIKEVEREKEKELVILNELIWTNPETINNNDFDKFKNHIKVIHDYLYSSSSVSGSKAQNDIIKIFMIKIINYLYNNQNPYLLELIENNKNEIKDDFNMNYFKDYYLLCKAEYFEDDWQEFIRVLHKIIPSIINKDDYILNTKDESDIRKLFSLINDIKLNDNFIEDFSTTSGSIYEYFQNDYAKGSISKELGQFFTPRNLINSILNGTGFKELISSYVNPIIYDPCCGSGSLLCNLLKITNSNPLNIHGCEIENDTIKFAEISLILMTNSFISNIKNSCCLTQKNIDENKYDIIVSNPPFGVKIDNKQLLMKFEKNNPTLKFEDIYPIKTNGTGLFIQHIIYKLKENGITFIILPDGKEMTSKQFLQLRKFIIDNCKILKIIDIQNNTFEHTGVKTKVLILQKHKNIDNDNHKNIEFLEVINNCNEVKLITKTDLNVNDYAFKLKLKEEVNEENNEGIEYKTLGEVCEIQNGTRIVKKDCKSGGEYPVYGGGDISFYTNTYNREGFNILIGRFGLSENCVRLINEKIFLNDSGLTIKPINENNLIHKYLGYYILNNQKLIYNISRGPAQKNLDINEFKLIKISIPSMEVQEEIVAELDMITNANKMIENNIKELNELNKVCLKSSLRFIEKEYKTLGEVCDIKIGGTPLRNNNSYFNGNNLWVSVSELNNNIINNTKEKITDLGVKNSNVKLLNKDTILFSFKLSIGKMAIAGVPLYTNEAIAGINIKNEDILNYKYLYYYLYNNNYDNLGNGILGKGCLNKSSLSEIKIPIPSIEVQEEIVNYCDNNNDIIRKLNETLNKNKKFMEMIIKFK